jgi:guanylate kinase
MKKRGTLFIISAPSGAGKTTLVRWLTENIPDLSVSVSHTTRQRRPAEEDGRDYHFIDEDTFRSLIADNHFLEHARVFDHYYGTSRTWVERQLADGRDIILEIDWQGAQQVRGQMPDAVGIFILPPSCETLQSRLQQRGDDADTVRRRTEEAVAELSHYREYDYLVINNDLDTARQDLAAIVRATRQGYRRQQPYYDEFMGRLLSGKMEIK